MVIEKNDASSQSMWLGILIVVVIVLMCFRLWPMWLKKGIWYISFYLLVFLIGAAFVRLILWGILYHFGLEFWLFPNYFVDSNDPRDSFLPLWSFEIREDMFDYRSIIFRMISGSLIVYMGYQFCQDEKNMEDLKDLANNGLDDLFIYGMEFTTGLALSDGKDKKNSTEEETSKSFSEKYREELKKDIDDLGLDDEDLALLKTDDSDPSDTNELKEGEGEPEQKVVDLDALMGDDDEEDTSAGEVSEPEPEKAEAPAGDL